MGLNQDVHVNLLIISVGKKCIPSNVLKIFENQYNKSQIWLQYMAHLL